MVTTDLRLGRWQEALADVEMVDAIITDPPYGNRTHTGHEHDARESSIGYAHWTPADVTSFVGAWGGRCKSWFVAFTSHDLVPAYELNFAAAMAAQVMP